MKCAFCDAVCRDLKKAAYVLANKKRALVGLEAGELRDAFAVKEYSFYVLAACLGGLYLLSGWFFALTLLPLLGVMTHRIWRIYENHPISEWFDFEFENWLNIKRSAASALLIFLICFAPMLGFAIGVFKGMPALREHLANGVPISGEIFRQTAKDELNYLFSLKPNANRVLTSADYVEQKRASESEIGFVPNGINAERKSWFWLTKLFSILLVVSMAWGIYNFPVGVACSAVSESFAQGLNIVRWRELSKNLAEDYGRVFFYWLCFLFIFAGTIYLEVKMGGGKIKDRSQFYYVLQFFLTAFRFYLLYVLATMLGRMLHKNQLAVRN